MKNNSAATNIILSLLLTSSFLIRFWGLQFEAGQTLFNNDAGPLYLRWAERFYQGNVSPARISGYWHNICYPFFAQYLMGVAGWIYAGGKYVWSALSYLTMSQPFPFTGRLSFTEQVVVGRLLQILLSTGLVYLIYRIGLNLLGRRAALVGAFLTAFAPQLINHSRHLQSDITVTFLTTLTVLFSSYILTRGGLRWYLLAGLTAGLSIGAKHNGALAILAIPAAHLGRIWAHHRGEGGPARHRYLSGAALFFLLGIGISYPVIWLDWAAFRKALPRFYWMQLITDKRETVTGSFWHHRWINIRRFATDAASRRIAVGLWIWLLGLLGVLKTIKTRKIKELFLVFFPLAYLFAVLIFRGNVRHKDFLPVTVFIPLIAASFLAFLVQALRVNERLKSILVWTPALLVAFPIVLSDLQVAYCCWQRDTRQLSADWIGENIAPGSRIVPERYCPRISSSVYNLVDKPFFLCYRPLEPMLDQGVDYLVSSSTAHGRFFNPYDTYYNESAQKYYRELDRRFLVKTFRIDNTGFIDPVIKIHYLKREGLEWEDKAMILRDLDFAYSESSPQIITLEDDLGYEGKSGFRVRGEEPVERIVIAPSKLSRIGLLVFPTSPDSTVKATVGGEKRRVRFETLEPRFVLFHPRRGFPFLKYLYRVRAESVDGDEFLVKIITSPRLLARLGGGRESPPEKLPLPGPERFDTWFNDFFRADPDWWREKYTHVYESEDLAHSEGWEEEDCSVSGGFSVAYRSGRDQPNCFVWGPYAYLPPQPWIASFRLRAGQGEGEGVLTVIEVTADQGGRILVRRELTRADFPENGFREFTLPFRVDYLGNPVEFRVVATGAAPLWSDRITVYPDLAGWFRANYPPLPINLTASEFQ